MYIILNALPMLFLLLIDTKSCVLFYLQVELPVLMKVASPPVELVCVLLASTVVAH